MAADGSGQLAIVVGLHRDRRALVEQDLELVADFKGLDDLLLW